MLTITSPRRVAYARSSAALFAILAGLVQAPAYAAENGDEADSIIVTGTRSKSSTVGNSSIPIDIVSAEALAKTGENDLRASIERLVPSVVHQNYTPVGAAFKETISIHGLNANHVLVLVNGKRRHTSANFTTYIGPQQSTTGVDLGFIPTSSIARIEVLRDGDSANYGADALAGVVNVILKDASSGGLLQGTIGQFYEGDGFSRNVSGNLGFKLGGDGFLNLSTEYSGRDHTQRLYQLATPPHRVPNFPATDRITLSYNAGIDLDGNVSLYSNGTYGHRWGKVFMSARGPTSLPAVYPNGYQPLEVVNEDDFGATVGLRVDNIAGWSADFSSTYGGNDVSFDITDSANLAYFAAFGSTPTNFHIYTINSKQWSNTADFSREVDVGFLSQPVNVAFGAELRREFFTVKGGDEPSYYSTGSQGVPGLSPQNAVDVSRTVIGAYAELSARLSPDWQVSASGRFERYSDTSDTTVGRLTSRYDISPAFAVRGTISTGFSAPSLGQQSFLNVSTGPASATGLLSPNSSAARFLGASSLKPERSTSLSGGIVLRPSPDLNVTIDAYQISIKDRIIPGGTAAGQAAADALRLAGFEILPTTPLSAVSASYLTNGADSRTRGIDLIASYRQGLGNESEINWSLSGNLNSTKLTVIARNANGTPVLNIQRRGWLTTATPKYKAIASGELTSGKWTLLLRENLFGPTTNHATYYSGPNAFSVVNFLEFRQGAKVTTDLSVSFKPTKGVQLSAGANNLFDAYPDQLPAEASLFGQRYDSNASQLGLFGGYYYLTLRASF